MSYKRNLSAQLFRLAREVEVWTRSETGTNEFGNVTDSHSYSHNVIAVRTYPNRNTEVESRVGDRNRDEPVFVIPIGPDQPDRPTKDDRLKYDGQFYEIKGETEYETHIEVFGDPVINETGA